MAGAKKHRLGMEHVAVVELRPDPFNPRRIFDAELEALTRSIREFGFVQPVVGRREDLTVICVIRPDCNVLCSTSRATS